LVDGATYQFAVVAINAFGSSPYSTAFPVIAATVPL
jgi:hypothetical protein